MNILCTFHISVSWVWYMYIYIYVYLFFLKTKIHQPPHYATLALIFIFIINVRKV